MNRMEALCVDIRLREISKPVLANPSMQQKYSMHTLGFMFYVALKFPMHPIPSDPLGHCTADQFC